MKVLHYADCTTLSWGVPYIAHMKALAELGVEQTLLCRGGDELERLAKENGIPVRTWKPLTAALPLLSPGFPDRERNFPGHHPYPAAVCRRHCGNLAFQAGDPCSGNL